MIESIESSIIASGVANLMGASIPCHVLSDQRRVFETRLTDGTSPTAQAIERAIVDAVSRGHAFVVRAPDGSLVDVIGSTVLVDALDRAARRQSREAREVTTFLATYGAIKVLPGLLNDPWGAS